MAKIPHEERYGFGVGFGGMTAGFPTMSKSFSEAEKRPAIGLTQGGSSRKGGGAKSAANNGMQKYGTTKKKGV